MLCDVQRERLRRVGVGEHQVAAALGEVQHGVVHVEGDEPALESLVRRQRPARGRLDPLAQDPQRQLVRQQNWVVDRNFEIEFLDPGVQAFAFTFG